MSSTSARSLFLAGLVALSLGSFALTGCTVADGTEIDASEESDAHVEFQGESAKHLREGCVQSNFNCKLPDHPYDDRDRNRFFTATGSIEWSIETTWARDGRNNVIGIIPAQKIEINYGQRKVIGGVPHVFGFRMHLSDGRAISAWVQESKIPGNTARMPTVALKDPGRGSGRTYTITGGNPAKYRDSAGRDLKISPNGVGNLEANDYLQRPTGIVNFLYSVPGFGIGGVATDTFKADIGTQFKRSNNVNSITVPTFSVNGTPGPSMKFIYGHVGDRYGWIAYDALTPQ